MLDAYEYVKIKMLYDICVYDKHTIEQGNVLLLISET